MPEVTLPGLWRFHQLEQGARRGTCCAVSPPPMWSIGAGQVSAAGKMGLRWASEAPGSFKVNGAALIIPSDWVPSRQLQSSLQLQHWRRDARLPAHSKAGFAADGCRSSVGKIWWLGMMGTTGSDVFTRTSASTRCHRHLFTRFCPFVSYSGRGRLNVGLNLSVVSQASRNACGLGTSFQWNQSDQRAWRHRKLGRSLGVGSSKHVPCCLRDQPPDCSRNQIKIRLWCWCDCARWKILSTQRGNKQLLSSPVQNFCLTNLQDETALGWSSGTLGICAITSRWRQIWRTVGRLVTNYWPSRVRILRGYFFFWIHYKCCFESDFCASTRRMMTEKCNTGRPLRKEGHFVLPKRGNVCEN